MVPRAGWELRGCLLSRWLFQRQGDGQVRAVSLLL